MFVNAPDDTDIVADRVGRMACGKCSQLIEVSDRPSFSDVECPHCGTLLKIPAQFGPFLLVEPLGSGGMGAVYRGFDPALGRFVAIKVMKQALGEDPELIESFLREARAAAALNHPNIVQIYSCGQEHGQPYIVMELVGGGRLDQLMADGKKVDEVRLLQVALDVSEGLKAANNAGLVHGDIKPANILFDQSGTAKVVDFGLAQFVNRQQEQGGIWGTPYYISPERARGGKADHRSDIYSLGATLFHALAGKPPFDGPTSRDVVVARLKGPPPHLRDTEPMLQAETDAVIHRMMSPDPVTRYPTSASLQADLRAALSAATGARGVARRAKTRDRGAWVHLVIGGGVAITFLIGAIFVIRWFVSSEPIPPPRPAARPTPDATTNGADTAAEGLTAKESAEGKLQLGVEFFSGAAETALVEAASILVTNPAAAREALESFATNVPARSARLMWVRVLQALPRWAEGDDAGATKILEDIVATPINQRRGHPVYMPQVLADYALGGMNDERLNREKEGWSAWYRDMVDLVSGASLLRQGKVDLALSKLDAYAKGERTAPAWVYGFRPAATTWVGQARSARERIAAIRGELGGLDPTAMPARIEAAVAETPPMARRVMDLLSNEVVQAQARYAEAQRRKAEEELAAAIERDQGRVNAVLQENRALLVEQRQYKRVAQLLDRVGRDLETDAGRARLALEKEKAERLEGLKNLLIETVATDPFTPADPELNGQPLSASARGLRISLNGQGTITKPWDQISPRLFMRMLAFYAARPNRAPAERGDIYLSMAVLSELHGARDTTTALLKQALQLNPDLSFTVSRLFPDVPTGGAP